MIKMKTKWELKIIIALALVVGLIPATALAQQHNFQTKTMTFDNPGDIFLMKEFGGAISTSGDTAKVNMVLPPAQRHADYKNLDVRPGDIIKIMNGQKISSASDMREIYDKLAIGDEIKLGLFRGKESRIVKFKKADPEKLPAQMMIIGGPQGDNSLALSMIQCGLMVKEQDQSLVVDGLANNLLPEYDGPTPQKGDVLIEIQGKPVASAPELNEIYDGLGVGNKVTLTLLREGNKIATSFSKPQPPDASSGQIKLK